MKKQPFSIFGRKKDLFGKNIEIKERDNVEMVLNSPAIPEMGTAKVRARPTVKHFNQSTTSSDAMQGFAVPIPKVPVLPPSISLKTSGKDGGERANGVSTPNLPDSKVFIPPPPSNSPPSPPTQFIPPPPPMFAGNPRPDLYSSKQPPTPPQKPRQALLGQQPDLTSLKPHLVTPFQSSSDPPSAGVGKPASRQQPRSPAADGTCKFPSIIPFATLTVPLEHAYTPSSVVQNTPPLKLPQIPHVHGQDGVLQDPAFPAQFASPSSFKPQDKAKLNSATEMYHLGDLPESEPRIPTSKPVILLQDSSAGQAEDKSLSVTKELSSAVSLPVPPAKPPQGNSTDTRLVGNHLSNLQITPLSDGNKAQGPPVQGLAPLLKQLDTPHPRPVEDPAPWVLKATQKQHLDVSRKPYYHRASRSTLKERATSPMALLAAAKKREHRRLRASQKNPDQTKSLDEPLSAGSHHTNPVGPSCSLYKPAPVASTDRIQSSLSPPVSAFPSIQVAEPSSSPTRNQGGYMDNLGVSLIPPPLEFANTQAGENPVQVELPLSAPPPNPMALETRPPFLASTHPNAHLSKASPGKVPALPIDLAHQLSQEQSSLNSSQMTLLSILHRKSLEMDQKNMSQETNANYDDWGKCCSDKESSIPPVRHNPLAKIQSKTPSTQNIVLKELENKVTRRGQDPPGAEKLPTSIGSHSKQGHGTTFSVRPGSKQPITVISKHGSPP